MNLRPANPQLMTLGDALGHVVMAGVAGWLLRRVDLRSALRVTGQRLPEGLGRRLERAAAGTVSGVWREAGRLGVETAPYQEAGHEQ